MNFEQAPFALDRRWRSLRSLESAMNAGGRWLAPPYLFFVCLFRQLAKREWADYFKGTCLKVGWMKTSLIARKNLTSNIEATHHKTWQSQMDYLKIESLCIFHVLKRKFTEVERLKLHVHVELIRIGCLQSVRHLPNWSASCLPRSLLMTRSSSRSHLLPTSTTWALSQEYVFIWVTLNEINM